MKVGSTSFKICFIASFFVVSQLMSMEYVLVGVDPKTNKVFTQYDMSGGNDALFKQFYPINNFGDVLNLIVAIQEVTKMLTPLAFQEPAPIPAEVAAKLINLKDDLLEYLNFEVISKEDELQPDFDAFYKSLHAEQKILIQNIAKRFKKQEQSDCCILATYGCVSIGAMLAFLLTSYLSCE